MTVAIYTRQSVEKDNSISCETQAEYCRAKLLPDERKGKIITYTDEGFSGATTDRKAFQKMMRDIERGKISKVIIYRLDRISRSLVDFVGILETFEQHSVKFISSQEGFDTSTDYGMLVCKILMLFAEHERKSIIARVTQAYISRSEKKIYMGGRRPFGFELEPAVINEIKTKRLVPNPQETECIKHIFETYSVENVTLRRLMANLESNGYMPTMGSWSTAKLSTIIKNPIYVKADNSIYEYYRRHNAQIISDPSEFDGVHGLQLYGTQKHTADDLSDIRVVVMTHEGVVSAAQWLKCQRKIESNKQIGNAVSNTTSWLGGKVYCKSCNRKLNCTKGVPKKDGSPTRYFSCAGKTRNHACEGIYRTIYVDSLEDMVYELISEKIASLKKFRKKFLRIIQIRSTHLETD